MTNSLSAILLFVLSLIGLSIFFSILGKLTFWKLVSYFPEEGLEFFQNNEHWIIQHKNDFAPPSDEYLGPMYFRHPGTGEMLVVFGKHEHLEQSQKEFVDKHRHLMPPYTFPWLSALSLLYPIYAMHSLENDAVDIVFILGYGYSNLGYILLVASLLIGSFKILGLDKRMQTFIAAVLFWLFGFVLVNI